MYHLSYDRNEEIKDNYFNHRFNCAPIEFVQELNDAVFRDLSFFSFYLFYLCLKNPIKQSISL